MKSGEREFARYAIPLAGLFFILIVAPSFYLTAMRDVFVFSKAIPLAIGAVLLWAGLAITGEATFERYLTTGIMATAAAVLASACFSVDLPLSILGPHQQQFYAILPLGLCVLAFYGTSNSEGMYPTIVVIMAISGGLVVSLLALTQIGGHGFMAWSIQSNRAGSTFGSPIFLGSYLAMLLPLAWVRRGEQGEWPRWACRAAFVLIAAGLLATRSRGSILAAACGIALIELLKGGKIGKVLKIIIPGVAIVGLMLLIRKTAHNSDHGRFEVWRIAILAWRAHPILGWGPDTFSLAFRQFMTQGFIDANNGNDKFIQLSAHNDFLQVLSTMGLIGLAAYSFLSIRVTRLLRNSLECDPETIGIAGAMLAVFVNAKFNPIPLSVMVIAACLVGSIDRWCIRDEHTVVPLQRTPAVIALGASILVACVVGMMSLAERHQRLGENFAQQMGRGVEAAEQFNIAAKINPFDLWYTQRQLDYFWLVIPRMPGVNKDKLAAFSRDISENISRLHPADPTAHELRALSYKFEGEMLGRDRWWEMDRELAVAERLAPGFSRYTERHAELRKLISQQHK